MKDIRIKFIEKIQRTPTVMSFRFLAPEKINFIPGQFLQVIFDENNRANKDLNKYLSFSSSPTKEYIEITKRISESQFSKRLLNLKSNNEILIKAPLGNIVFLDEYKAIAFLIGGIGVTPVISIIEYICDKGLDTDVLLFYSNRRDDDIAFREELDSWQKINKNIRIVYTVTECPPKDKKCVFGFIDKALISEKKCDLANRMVFIFGPPKMVKSMQDLCFDCGCQKENVKIENFIGY
ncbi:MAG: FAD-dependent oxidoreductase [Candidatus Omnitrophota bacterium]|jgi:ferredoxin-NADP reductase